MGKILSKSKSKCTVYIRLPVWNRVGHAVLELANGTYISWWPEGGKGMTFKVPGTSNTLKDDKQIEGEPDYTLLFPPDIRLDKKAMKRWWQEFQNRGTWNVVTNCCWVVIETLIAGGIREHVNIDRMTIDNPIDLKNQLTTICGIDIRAGKSSDNVIKKFFQMVWGAIRWIIQAITWIVQNVVGSKVVHVDVAKYV